VALSVFRLPPAATGSAALLAASAASSALERQLKSVNGGAQVHRAVISTIELDSWPSMAMLEVAAAPGYRADEAAESADEALERYALTGPEPAEIQMGRHILIHRWMQSVSTAEGKAVDMALSVARLDNPLGRAERSLGVVKVSDADVRDAARYLNPDRCARLLMNKYVELPEKGEECGAGPARPCDKSA
jgi:hypothetical protein